MKKLLICFMLLILFFELSSASLGISPAIKNYDFVSGERIVIDYNILSDDSEREIILSLEGDLAEFAILSKKKLIGPGSFKVTLNLPEDFGVPGEHVLSVGAREIPSEDQFLGTAIDIRAVLKVFVPYPGKYLDVNLNVLDGNINEKIPIEVYVINRGIEGTNLGVKVLFFDSTNDLIYTMPFKDVFLETGNERYFRKFLNTSEYRPGTYLAEAVVSYGDESRVNSTFRIGSLFVNITDFTKSLSRRGIQKFFINIESKWNGNLNEIYAEVNLSNDMDSIQFRTPSIDLNAWDSGILEGFLDTDKLDGAYETNIVLNYGGQQTFASGYLTISNINLSLVIGVIISILLIIVIVVWMTKRKNRNKK